MSLPLPPTNPNLTIPSRVVDNNRRLRRREGLTLPTPRTYRNRVASGTVTVTTTPQEIITLPIFMQPFEAIGIMCAVDIRSSAASTIANVYIDPASWPYSTGNVDLININAVPVHATNFSTFVSKKPGSDDGTGFIWTNAARDASNNIVTPASPTAYTLSVKVSRFSGSGTLTIATPQIWAMIV